MKVIKVLVVDDSELTRQMLSQIINSADDLEVVGVAADPYDAREKIKQLNPDVLTLDVEMPKMDGITFLRNIMKLRPMPVVMISTLTKKGAPATLEALDIGAVDFLPKPQLNHNGSLQGYRLDVIEKVRGAASANIHCLERSVLTQLDSTTLNTAAENTSFNRNCIIAIGASTGGTEAIKEVLVEMPASTPPILLTQHIPPAFSKTYAERLNQLCSIDVVEAEDGMKLEQGCAYLAPGDYHIKLIKKSSFYYVQVDQSDLVNRHRPSVDVMFDSVLNAANTFAVGVLLTGMGKDGASGLLRMKEAGCKTIVQDRESSVIWGMPGAAYEMGAAVDKLPLDEIHSKALNYCIKR